VSGDVNFDFVVDCTDVDIAQSLVGATLDDTTPDIDPSGVAFDRFVYQGRQFQQLLVAINMDQTDGVDGENSLALTQADVDAIEALSIENCCPTDLNGDGITNINDLVLCLGAFGQSDEGDTDDDGDTDINDLVTVLGEFGNPC